ncbi:uncharacterized protein [Parasteatoda tepidariorum]|uniref:uncharacterized protein n=1 Tax=Parasteatoda tepidariorum TaxID=114398 RepID=UPI00077FD80F|nr:uncharacterized protein LOC107447597 [Parasteatoda tepidariorum]
MRLFKVNLNLCQEVLKKNTDTTILRSLANEATNNYYPEDLWLHIFTDYSLLFNCNNAGPGISSKLLLFYTSVGQGAAFDGEITTIRAALSQIHCHHDQFTKAVIFCDSKAALQSINSSDDPQILEVMDCRRLLRSLESHRKIIVLQWETRVQIFWPRKAPQLLKFLPAQ